MTSTAATSGPSSVGHAHPVHHRRGSAGAAPPSELPAAAPATPTAGTSSAGSVQPLASGLQSVLLDAQAKQPATQADGSTATTGVASQVADRLQSLLGGDSTGSADLKSVLDRLQQTLQQTLQSYRTAAPAASSGTIVA